MHINHVIEGQVEYGIDWLKCDWSVDRNKLSLNDDIVLDNWHVKWRSILTDLRLG